jgi:hypothetical protein
MPKETEAGMYYYVATIVLVSCILTASQAGAASSDWIPLFNGQNLEGWKASENKDTFRVEDGAIVAKGERSHLFYAGPVQNADFKNFELKVDVLTKPNANGGIYFHTRYQETGWPDLGFEAQVNNSYARDHRKTGSLYMIQDITVPLAKDNEWFSEHIIVAGKRVIVKINDRVVVDWTEPDTPVPPQNAPGRVLNRGTFALQGHDPGSEVHYRNILVKPLPDDLVSTRSSVGWLSLFDGRTLDGWQQINGTGRYQVHEGTILGETVEGSPNSFLCTKRHYRDFELEFEVLLDPRLNSGVQIRSLSLPEYKNGRVHGYQVEIATGGNAGFIYDEARRGWLSTDRSDEQARKAFKDGEWNHYRIVAVGETMRVWINGVPIEDLQDSMTPSGFIGLQVHSFEGQHPAWVRWRNIRIKELSTPS